MLIKTKYITILFLILLLTLFTGCGNNTESNKSETKQEVEENEEVKDIQTGFTNPVPDSYLTESVTSGIVEEFSYNSKDYLRGETDITKTAYVYLPYNYNPDKSQGSYNILYLMHGWYGHAGDFFWAEDGTIKNVIDHMIENGEMESTIIVSPSFYNDNSGNDFTSSKNELNEFHRDFTENLMPAIEGTYNTYANSNSPEDLMASRNHRAFGGFSMGAVTAWNEFCYDTDYISYFLPISGSSWFYDDNIDNYATKMVDYFEEVIKEKNLNDRGYYIYAATGTDDYQRGKLSELMAEMLERSETFKPERLQYVKKQGGQHDMIAVREYLYNALPYFFKPIS